MSTFSGTFATGSGEAQAAGGTGDSPPQGGRPRRSWSLATATQARQTLARLLREFHRSESPDVAKFRAEVYALSTLLNYFAFERDTELEDRVAEIEAELGRRS